MLSGWVRVVTLDMSELQMCVLICGMELSDDPSNVLTEIIKITMIYITY